MGPMHARFTLLNTPGRTCLRWRDAAGEAWPWRKPAA